ncbi:hypothetical protein GPL15_07975 [Clostridium sp. MCC353]|uniref:hypothetical protein n=1 Tax=Clostridium sp. MCC353 TaxID=2592646 RepID=UPI001C0183D7|nr:hypothetical protein [Clostridium sp. MCC353]MBT9776438.1 hypothetical protein [Clostridium sp. MCC353]
MKKRLLNIGLAAMLLLTACSTAKTPDQSAPSQENAANETAASMAGAQPDETAAEMENVTNAVEGYQLVPDYGICEKGSAPIYVMNPEERPTLKEDDAEIQLLGAVYQNGKTLARFRIKDYSAEVIPEEEADVLLAKEKEYYRKQEAGEPAQWDGSYITIDEERKILVRSSFEQRRKAEEETRSGPDEKRYKCIYGAGIPEVGYSFTKSTSSYDYDQFLEEGCITTLSEYCIEDKLFEVPEPDGTYEIKMPGFTNTLSFEFVPAVQIESLESLPGYISHGGVGIYALGNYNEQGAEIRYYTYSSDNDRVFPVMNQCTFEKGGKIYEKGTSDDYLGGANYNLAGIGKGMQGERIQFEVPEADRNGSFTFRIPQIRVTSQEMSEVLEIQIPEKESTLDHRIEFADSIITITKAERLEEPVYYGNIDGKDVKKPAVYLSMEIEEKAENKVLAQILGTRMDTKQGEKPNPFMSHMVPVHDPDGEPKPYGRLTGFYVFYEEEDQGIQVQFRNPTYLWNQEFVLPIEPEGNQ